VANSGNAGAAVDLRTDAAHSARVHDYLLGGTTNYAADREAAERARTALPHIPAAALQNRAFLARAVRHVADQGVPVPRHWQPHSDQPEPA
jgi:hypothetical protein